LYFALPVVTISDPKGILFFYNISHTMSVANFLQDGQDPKVVEKIHSKILDMLEPAEQVQYIAVQKKPAVTLLPDSITISNTRIFLCEFTKLGLATNFEIFPWENIKDIAFKEEIFGSKVTVIPFTGENLTVDYIPKVQARKLYQLIKVILQEVNNPKKQKPIVEKPKAQTVPIILKNEPSVPDTSISSRSIQTSNPPRQNAENNLQTQNDLGTDTPTAKDLSQQINPTPSSATKTIEEDELTQKLRKLKSLYDRQLITQAEYENKKQELLSQL